MLRWLFLPLAFAICGGCGSAAGKARKEVESYLAVLPAVAIINGSGFFYEEVSLYNLETEEHFYTGPLHPYGDFSEIGPVQVGRYLLGIRYPGGYVEQMYLDISPLLALYKIVGNGPF